MNHFKNLYWLALIVLISLSGCDREYTEPLENIRIDRGPLVFPGTTHVFDEVESDNYIMEYSPSSGKIIMKKNQFTASIGENHILMIGPSEQTPYGALRKVTNINEKENEYEFITIQGALNEAVLEGELVANLRLSSSDLYQVQAMNGIRLKSASETNIDLLEISLDNVDLTGGHSNFPVYLNGIIKLDVDPEVKIKFNRRNPPEVTATIVTTFYENVSITTGYEMEISDEITIYEAYFSPIVIWGIVLIPKLEILAGYDGDFSTQISFTTEQEIVKTYVVSNTNQDEPSKINSPNSVNGNSNLDLDGTANLSVYTGPQVEILVFGLVGPYVNLTGGISLTADINKCPWWELQADMNGELGIEGDIFGLEDIIKVPFELGTWDIASTPNDGCFLPPGRIEGRVVDAYTKNPVSNVKVSISDQPADNFNELNSTNTDASGNYLISINPGSNYYIKFEKNGYQTYEYLVRDQITEGQTLYLGAELQINNNYLGNGSFGGIIVNAFTGLPIQNAHLELFEGKNSTSSQAVKTGHTNTDGSYVFYDVPAGHYTLSVSKEGFISNKVNIICLGGQSIGNQNGTLSPEMSDNEWRIVLTWGETPLDLDSHITGPIEGAERFHVYWDIKSFNLGDFMANLDVDDVNSFGPETVTLKNINNEIYRYSVHDFTNRKSTYSNALSNSEAKVIIYNGGELVADFNVPNQDGTLWTVFEIRNNNLININSMEYESNSPNVKSVRLNSDSRLIRDLPNK